MFPTTSVVVGPTDTKGKARQLNLGSGETFLGPSNGSEFLSRTNAHEVYYGEKSVLLRPASRRRSRRRAAPYYV